jgi:hypothetical protein
VVGWPARLVPSGAADYVACTGLSPMRKTREASVFYKYILTKYDAEDTIIVNTRGGAARGWSRTAVVRSLKFWLRLLLDHDVSCVVVTIDIDVSS